MKSTFLCIGAIAVIACACASANDVAQSSDELAATCPTTPPANGSSCDRRGHACSYGDDARFGCRTIAKCGDDVGDKVWVVDQAACPEPPPTCPKTAPTAGDRCSAARLGITCVLDQVAYTCTPCSGTLCFTESTWSASNLAVGCPAAMPNLGDTCSARGLYCDYNVCADDQIPPNQWAYGMGFECKENGWVFYGGDEACL